MRTITYLVVLILTTIGITHTSVNAQLGSSYFNKDNKGKFVTFVNGTMTCPDDKWDEYKETKVKCISGQPCAVHVNLSEYDHNKIINDEIHTMTLAYYNHEPGHSDFSREEAVDKIDLLERKEVRVADFYQNYRSIYIMPTATIQGFVPTDRTTDVVTYFPNHGALGYVASVYCDNPTSPLKTYVAQFKIKRQFDTYEQIGGPNQGAGNAIINNQNNQQQTTASTQPVIINNIIPKSETPIIRTKYVKEEEEEEEDEEEDLYTKPTEKKYYSREEPTVKVKGMLWNNIATTLGTIGTWWLVGRSYANTNNRGRSSGRNNNLNTGSSQRFSDGGNRGGRSRGSSRGGGHVKQKRGGGGNTGGGHSSKPKTRRPPPDNFDPLSRVKERVDG